MKKILSIACCLLLSGSVLVQAGLDPVGHYENMVMGESEDPHYNAGFRVRLYQERDRLCAKIGVATGSLEPAAAQLHKLTFDPGKNRLTFEADYPGGRVIDGASGLDGREVRNMLTFSGTVYPDRIVGTMTTREIACSECEDEVESVTLEKLEQSD
jgi:hypothetical protein